MKTYSNLQKGYKYQRRSEYHVDNHISGFTTLHVTPGAEAGDEMCEEVLLKVPFLCVIYAFPDADKRP